MATSPTQPERISWVDVSLLHGTDETQDEAITRNRELYVHGYISLADFEYRVEVIVTEREP